MGTFLIMKKFKVYSNPVGKYEAVKVGWSWPGVLFGALWALFCKMWTIGLGVISIFFVLNLFAANVHGSDGVMLHNLISLASVCVSILFGVKGNIWRENNLIDRGYEFEMTTNSKNKEAAIASFLKEPLHTSN